MSVRMMDIGAHPDDIEILAAAEHGQLSSELFHWKVLVLTRQCLLGADLLEDPQKRRELRIEELTAQVASLDRPQDVLKVIVVADGGRAVREALIFSVCLRSVPKR